ncbi:MAG: hypothetical protein ACXABY_21335 [Candidatus Thorarchaeota archaeon]|jgi:hypothetical protein
MKKLPFKVRESHGVPIYLNPDIEDTKTVPKEAVLLEGMDVWVFTIMGDYAHAIIRKNIYGEFYAEDEYHLWPIKYSEVEGCYVTHSMINKSCIDLMTDKLKQTPVTEIVTGS